MGTIIDMYIICALKTHSLRMLSNFLLAKRGKEQRKLTSLLARLLTKDTETSISGMAKSLCKHTYTVIFKELL